VPGVEGYFDMVNAQGGIDGKKINLAYNLDDGSNPTNFTQLSHTVINQDHALAVMVASFYFSPDYFASTGTPTYGYNVSGNWQGPDNLFAAGGSVQYYPAGVTADAYFLDQTHSPKVAFISYGPAISSSYDACNTGATILAKNGYDVTYSDFDAQLDSNYTSAVQRMQQSGTDAVISCMQDTDNVTMAREFQQYGVKIHQLWLNGYDRTLLSQYKSLMQGVYLNLSGNVPFEAGQLWPSQYPGMQSYLTYMNKYQPAYTYNDQATQGWQSAALLVEGIKAVIAAHQSVTPANIIKYTNTFTANNGGGLATITDWTNAHTTVTYPDCSAWVQVQGSKFVPVFLAKGNQVFTCFAKSPVKNPPLVTAPAGTPGA
jgi:branched-chain amino acid transport system substrate-binding protein